MVIPLLLLLSSSSYCCIILSEGAETTCDRPYHHPPDDEKCSGHLHKKKEGMKYIHVLYIYIVYSIEFVESTRLIGKNTFKYTLSRAFVTLYVVDFFENTAFFIGWDVASGTSMRRLVREMKNNFTFQDDEKDDD